MATLILYLRSNWHVLQWSANSIDTFFSHYKNEIRSFRHCKKFR